MTLSVEVFQPDDLFEIEVRQEDQLVPRGRIINAHNDLEGIAYSFRWNKKLIGIAGGAIMFEGNANLWAIINNRAMGHARAIRKAANHLLIDAAKHLKIRRYNILVHGGSDVNKKWASFLGFTQEGKMYKAAPDGNHMLHYVLWMEAPDGLII